MSTNITHDIDYLSRLQSSKSSSVVNIPTGKEVDLDKCGAPTHKKAGFNFTANWLDECVPAGIALQASLEGLVSVDIDSSVFAFSDTLSGVALLTDGAKFTQYLLGGLPAGGVGPINKPFYTASASIATLLGANSQDIIVKVLGPNINVYSKGANSRLIATITRPSLSVLKDRCGSPVGFKSSGSISLNGFDSTTCRPELVWSHSQGVAYNSTLYAQTETVKTNIWTDYKSTEIFSITGNVDETDDQIRTTVESAYMSLLNLELVLGD